MKRPTYNQSAKRLALIGVNYARYSYFLNSHCKWSHRKLS